MPIRQTLFWIGVGALVLVTICEVVFYPFLAEWAHDLFGGQEAAGSSIGYFRDFYVAPGAVVFLVAFLFTAWLTSRTGRWLVPALIGAWILNVVLLFASSLWYFHAIHRAMQNNG